MDVDATNVDCAITNELLTAQFRRELSPITSCVHTPFKRPRIVEGMCSSLCDNKLCSENTEVPPDFQHFFQSNNVTGRDTDTSVSADTGHFISPVNSSADVQSDLLKALTTIKKSTPLKETSFHLRMKTTLNDLEDLDESLLELEENEVDGEDPINLTSEEIDIILQESNDETVVNAISPVLKFDDVSRVVDKTPCKYKSVSDSLLSLSPPNASNWPKNYLVLDEIQTSYLNDVSSTDATVLKVEQEINQSLKPELHNISSVHESSGIEKSNLSYYLSVEEFSLFNETPVCADEAIDEGNHAGSNNEACPSDRDKMLITNPASCSPNLLKDHNKLTFWEQKISERIVSFIEEKAEVKENISFPVHSGDEVGGLKDASKHKQNIVESVKEENLQKHNPTKIVAEHKESRQTRRLDYMFDPELERRKHLYLQLVSNHMKSGCEIQGATPNRS
ncbi:uncharacterized protein [Heterodontus francisci]|uniref:uncharacterized protein isoform X2 n=1 Tax=Heterodontus francisci TaxID=7792 RepID=UPI00355B0F61